MSENKWMKQLLKNENAVDGTYDPFAIGNVLQSPSPSLNWIFGKGSGIPYGYSAVLYGEPKMGKSLISNLLIGHMHNSHPDYMALKYNTEMREEGQMADYWGIDNNRYMAMNTNKPNEIFDHLMDEIRPMVQQGMPLKMINIDSLQGIQGVRESNAKSVTDTQIGDNALTIQKGLKYILELIRKHKIALVCTSQMRANLDSGMYGPKTKMAGSFGQKHFFEYFIEVKRDNSADGKKDLLGNTFLNDDVKDFKDNKEKTAHKIYVTMADSSMGRGTNRSGEFTLSYDKGLINVHEEVFNLARMYKIITTTNNRTYTYNGQDFNGKPAVAKFLMENPNIAQEIMKEIYARDM